MEKEKVQMKLVTDELLKGSIKTDLLIGFAEMKA